MIDREEVILDIFAKRARSREARLQVELARMQYALPRLARMWGHLDREGGSGGMGGGAARGIKGGIVRGATDELGYNAVEQRTSVHDLHATMLHLFGIDHARFSYKFQGLDARLTGVEPSTAVIRDILA